MNFEHFEYLPWIILAFAAFLVVLIWLERKFFHIVKLYWFYKRSFFSYLSSFLFVLGMGLLLTSLLDLRGPEEKIKSGVPTERTIILIDTSASMLAEDVKPSRLQKAALVAKHFARKATGHQISVVAFAEIQKKIVPFTNDLDLIDSRLESIKLLRNQNGSSALTAAIQESLSYFKETGEARGNILVLTDGEETANDIDLKLPKEVHLALVGVGTAQGGRIPLDDGRGFRYGYKKNRGSDVITKLNEKFFKSVVADVPSGEYWLANTYSLPSDEILEFFKSEVKKGDKEQDMVIKPVLMEWIVVPAVILLILSYFVKSIRIFSLGLFLLIMPVQAQETEEAKEPKELSPAVQKKMQLLQKGELTRLEKLKLADELYKSGVKDESLALYEENLPKERVDQSIPPEAYLNYGTALLEKGEGQKALAIYDTVGSSLDPKTEQGKKINDMIEKNIVNYFQVQEQKKEQQKKDEKEKKEKKDNKDQKEQGSGGQGSDQKGQQGQGQDDQKKKDKKEEGQKPEEKKEDGKGEGDEKKDQKEKDGEDKEGAEKDKPDDGDGKKKLPAPKLPSKLKQLMSDDRQLQLKMIEQGTREMNRRTNRENKDW